MANTFKNYRGDVSAGTDTVIVPESSGTAFGRTRSASSTCVVHAVFISNTDGGSSVNVDITVYNGTDSYFIGYQLPVPAGSTLILDKPINLETTDRLRVKTTSANDIDVVCAVLEIT
jgi:hypothetical protein